MIYINLIPRSLWYLNLRKLLTDNQWKKLSQQIKEEQSYVCQACSISIKQLKNKKYFHCHEMWEFCDNDLTVNLLCLITLCSYCHLATHIGFASINNKYDFAFNHLCKVNKWDQEIAKLYIEANFEQWSQRSNKKWKINIDSFNDWLDEDMLVTLKRNLIKNY